MDLKRWLWAGLLLLPFSTLLTKTDRAFNKMLDSLLSGSVEFVHVHEIKAAGSYVFLDAREKKEYDVSRIAGARWVGYKDFDLARLDGIAPNAKIIVYCSVGYRSEKIGEKLEAAGFTNVQNLFGGIFAWVNNGRALVNEAGPTKDVHPYDKNWGRWLKAGRKIYQ